MRPELPFRAYLLASASTVIVTIALAVFQHTDIRGFFGQRLSILLVRSDSTSENVEKFAFEHRGLTTSSAAAAFVVTASSLLMFVSLSLSALHNGHKSGLGAEPHITSVARAARIIVLVSGLAVVLERTASAMDFSPFLIAMRGSAGEFGRPTVGEAWAAIHEHGDAVREERTPEGVQPGVFWIEFSFDLAYAALLYSVLEKSKWAQGEGIAARVSLVTAFNSVVVFTLAAIAPYTRPFSFGTQATLFVFSGLLLIGTCVFNIVVLHLASQAEFAEAERCRQAWEHKFDPDSEWVSRTTRARTMLTLYASVVVVSILQFMQGALFVFADSDLWYLLLNGTITVLIMTRGLGIPTCCFVVYITSRAHAASCFNNLATRHEEAQRNEFQKLIVRYVCHEVRVPLNSLALGMELLADGLGMGGLHSDGADSAASASQDHSQRVLTEEDLAEQRKTLVEMSSSLSSMERILNDVLQVQALEQGRIGLVYEPFDPRDLVADVDRMFGKEARKKGIQLEGQVVYKQPVSAGVLLRGDKGRLLQVCANFVSNALKFTPGGRRIHATVSVAPVDFNELEMDPVQSDESLLFAGDEESAIDSKNVTDMQSTTHPILRLEYSLTDEGVGIQRSDIPKLFKPFHQLDSGAKFKQHSTGLGLSICKGIVDMHGGKIRVQSRGINHGATFSFVLPIEAVPPDGTATMDIMAGLQLPTQAAEAPHFRGVAGSITGSGLTRTTEEKSEPSLPSASVPLPQPIESASGPQPEPAAPRVRGPSSRMVVTSATPDPVSAPGEDATPTGPHTTGSAGEASSHGERHDRAASAKHAAGAARDSVRPGPARVSSQGSEVESLPHVAGRRRHLEPLRRAPKPAIAPQTRSPLTCLVVDDVSGNRMFLQRLLTRMGHTVFAACNGREGVDKALEILCTTSHLLVLMDGNMPVLDGVSATKELLARADPGRVVVVAVTGNAHPADRAAFMDAGAVEVVAKPVKRGELQRVLETHQTSFIESAKASVGGCST